MGQHKSYINTKKNEENLTQFQNYQTFNNFDEVSYFENSGIFINDFMINPDSNPYNNPVNSKKLKLDGNLLVIPNSVINFKNIYLSETVIFKCLKDLKIKNMNYEEIIKKYNLAIKDDKDYSEFIYNNIIDKTQECSLLAALQNCLLPENTKNSFSFHIFAFCFTDNSNTKSDLFYNLIEVGYKKVTSKTFIKTLEQILKLCYSNISNNVQAQLSSINKSFLGIDLNEISEYVSFFQHSIEIIFNLKSVLRKINNIKSKYNNIFKRVEEINLNKDFVKKFYLDNSFLFNIFTTRKSLIKDFENNPKLLDYEFGIDIY